MSALTESEDPDYLVHAAWLAQGSKAADRLPAEPAEGGGSPIDEFLTAGQSPTGPARAALPSGKEICPNWLEHVCNGSFRAHWPSTRTFLATANNWARRLVGTANRDAKRGGNSEVDR